MQTRNRPNELTKEGLGGKAPKKATGFQGPSSVYVLPLLQINLGTNCLLSQQDPLSISLSQKMILWLPISENHAPGLVKKPDPKYFQNTQETGDIGCL